MLCNLLIFCLGLLRHNWDGHWNCWLHHHFPAHQCHCGLPDGSLHGLGGFREFPQLQDRLHERQARQGFQEEQVGLKLN